MKLAHTAQCPNTTTIKSIELVPRTYGPHIEATVSTAALAPYRQRYMHMQVAAALTATKMIGRLLGQTARLTSICKTICIFVCKSNPSSMRNECMGQGEGFFSSCFQSGVCIADERAHHKQGMLQMGDWCIRLYTNMKSGHDSYLMRTPHRNVL